MAAVNYYRVSANNYLAHLGRLGRDYERAPELLSGVPGPAPADTGSLCGAGTGAVRAAKG